MATSTSSQKTPYQIRQELIVTAKEYLEQLHYAQKGALDAQYDMLTRMMDSADPNKFDFKKPMEELTEGYKKLMSSYPGTDQIIKIAEMFQGFVDGKK